jgi:hypothetical protein
MSVTVLACISEWHVHPWFAHHGYHFHVHTNAAMTHHLGHQTTYIKQGSQLHSDFTGLR